jgi:DNA repair protein RecO (recombination protein O)
MLTKCKAIVLKTVDYSESSVVLKCYTDAFGLQSYIINGVRGKKGSIKPSHLQPLNLLEIEAYHQQNKQLQRIKELKCYPPLQHLHLDMLKTAVGLFVSEVIYKTIKEENHPDELLFQFLYSSIQVLDLHQGRVGNFPLFFLTRYCKFLGFLPKGFYSENTNGFDIREGVFEPYHSENPYQLSPEYSLVLHAFNACNANQFDELQLSHQIRISLLESLMEYYKIHIDGMFEIKSHKILAEVLA